MCVCVCVDRELAEGGEICSEGGSNFIVGLGVRVCVVESVYDDDYHTAMRFLISCPTF